MAAGEKRGQRFILDKIGMADRKRNVGDRWGAGSLENRQGAIGYGGRRKAIERKERKTSYHRIE
jgi:hypothetical protein